MFTFAELEESEQDLKKLARWLVKIQKRDFFPDDRWVQATEMVERCRSALARFSVAVYEAEKVQEPTRRSGPGKYGIRDIPPPADLSGGGPAIVSQD